MKNQQFSTPTTSLILSVMIYAYKYGKIRKRRFYYQRKLVLNCQSHTEKYQCLYFIKIAHLYVDVLSLCGITQTINVFCFCVVCISILCGGLKTQPCSNVQSGCYFIYRSQEKNNIIKINGQTNIQNQIFVIQ